MPYQPAEASNLSKPQVFSLAESVAKQIGFEPGGDIIAAVKRVGGSVVVQDTLVQDPQRSGSLFVDGVNDFKIVVPSHTSQVRDRFTVAHELGHYVVHYLWRKKQADANLDKMVAYRKGSERIEWEANWFAAAFLMPSEAFKSQYHLIAGDLRGLAAHFGVSVDAARIRAVQLGLA